MKTLRRLKVGFRVRCAPDEQYGAIRFPSAVGQVMAVTPLGAGRQVVKVLWEDGKVTSELNVNLILNALSGSECVPTGEDHMSG